MMIMGYSLLPQRSRENPLAIYGSIRNRKAPIACARYHESICNVQYIALWTHVHETTRRNQKGEKHYFEGYETSIRNAGVANSLVLDIYRPAPAGARNVLHHV